MLCVQCHAEAASLVLALFVLRESNLDERLAELQAAAERVSRLPGSKLAASTERAYSSDIRGFNKHLARYGLSAFPASPEHVAAHVAWVAYCRSPAAARRRATAIRRLHEAQGLKSPTDHRIVREVMIGLSQFRAPSHRKLTMTAGSLRALLASTDTGLKGTRDRAILLLCFYSGLARSEVAGLDIDDLRFEKRGAVVTVRQTRVSMRARSRQVVIERNRSAEVCPVAALEAWIAARGCAAGPLFWTFARKGKPKYNRIDGRDVTRLVQSSARRADVPGDFGASSFRLGNRAISR